MANVIRCAALIVSVTTIMCVNSEVIKAQVILDPYAVPNWKSEAKKNMRRIDRYGHETRVEDVDLRLAPRCVRINNYWCLKQPDDDFWFGSIGVDDGGHARFKTSVAGARAAVRNLRTWYSERNLRTLRAISYQQATLGDCIGSDGVGVKAYGKCLFGKNKPEQYAKDLETWMNISRKKRLILFDSKGRLTPTGILLLRQMSRLENGIKKQTDKFIAKEELIRAGAVWEKRDFDKKLEGKLY